MAVMLLWPSVWALMRIATSGLFPAMTDLSDYLMGFGIASLVLGVTLPSAFLFFAAPVLLALAFVMAVLKLLLG